MPGNAILVNFSGGETSPKSRGRFDAPWYLTAARKIVNFIADVLGPARYRPGFKIAGQTRGGAVPRTIPFQVNNDRAYMLEFTPGFMRVYKNGALLTNAAATVTGITRAATAVITVADATAIGNGDEIILTGVVGMPEINGRQMKLANNVGLTFQLVDPVTGGGIVSTNFGVYTSGGTVGKVYQLASPYGAGDLPSLQVAQNNTTMYLVCPTVVPYKLTVDVNDVFALGTFVRTNDPFVAGTALTVSAAGGGVWRSTKADVPGGYAVIAGHTVVAFPAGTVIVPGAVYTFTTVVGTVEINTGTYTLTPFVYNDALCNVILPSLPYPLALVMAEIRTPAGAAVNSAAWTAYISGGIATPPVENPIAVGFYEGRLGYFGTNQRPGCLFLSMGPDSSGNSRYDTFTGGSNADNACFFQLAPVSGSVDYISWARGGPDHLFVGTFGGPFRVSGSGLDIPITPSSINVRQFDTAGCEETMAVGCAQIFFIQRGGTTLRSTKVVNPYLATFEAVDMCLNAEQIMYSPLRRVVFQQGRPNVVWVTRADGILCGLSVHATLVEAQAVAGWHRHKIGGTSGKVLDVGVLQRTNGLDLLYAATERVINGVTRRFVEVMADEAVFPDPEDFFTANKTADLTAFQNAVYRAQERYVHLDGALTYDGSVRGITAAASMTPSAVSGTGITLTAGAAVFAAADVGAEIWKKPDPVTGLGGGRATITAFTDSQHVTATVTVAFNSTAAIAAGDWYFAVKTVYGLGIYDGQQVAVVTDGGVYSDGGTTGDDDYPTVTPALGKTTLTDAAAVIHVGLPYAGFLESHNLEVGGRTGPAQAKPRTISEMYVRFMNSLGVEYGTDLYMMEKVDHRLSDAQLDRPAPVFSGIKRLLVDDVTSGLDDATREKRVVIAQRLPLPATVEFIDARYDAADDA